MKFMLVAYCLLPTISNVVLADLNPNFPSLITDDLGTVTVPQPPNGEMSALSVTSGYVLSKQVLTFNTDRCSNV